MKKVIVLSVISVLIIGLVFVFAIKTVQKENKKRDTLNSIKYDSIKAKRIKESLYIIESARITDFKFDVVKAGGRIQENPDGKTFYVISSDGRMDLMNNAIDE